MAYYLGIDLGTTFTAAATVRDGSVETQTLGTRTVAIPSVVFLRDDGEILVGEVAIRRAATDPGRVAREYKRRVGDPTPLILGGVPCRPEMLMAKLLRWSVDTVTERLGEAPAAIALTHPANWGAFKLDLLTQAIHQVDLEAALLMPEPVAAATFYATERPLEPGALVAVYDLGGGSFDTAVVRRTPGGFELVGTPEGIERLGGVDFDEAVLAHVRTATGGALDDLDPDDPAARAAMLRLRQECTDAKEALSSDTGVTIPVLAPGVQAEVRLNRTEMEAMIRPAIAETIAALRRALGSAGVTPADVSAVLLVGGSSRIPLVAEMVSAELGRPIAVDAHPKDAVPVGAALAMAAHAPALPPPPPPLARPRPVEAARPPRPPRQRRRLVPILLTIVGVTLATGLLTASTATSAAAGRATDSSDRARATTALVLATMGPEGLVTKLRDERNFAAVYLLGMENVVQLPVSSFEDAMRSTDTAIAALREQLQAEGGDAAQAYDAPLADLATALPSLRGLMTGNTDPRGTDQQQNISAISAGYAPHIDALLSGQEHLATDIADSDQRRAVSLLALNQRHFESVATLVRLAEMADLAVDNADPGLNTVDEVTAVGRELERVDSTSDAMSSAGTGAYQPAVEALLADPGTNRLLELVDEAVTSGQPNMAEFVSSGSSNLDAHRAFHDDVMALMTGHIDDLETEAVERKQSLEANARMARIAALVVLVAMGGLAFVVHRRRPKAGA